MPTEKDVLERKWWWCPKWYWPFAVCSGIRTQHKWCYNFAWVRETRYGFVLHLEGCENGRLYTWTKAGLGLGSTTYPGGELCFDSSLGSDEGRCDPSRTGLQASPLSASEPYASDIDYDVLPLNATVVDRGAFDFTGEYERLCQSGVWPWKRTLHEKVIVATVTTRFGTIRWFVGGMPITGNSGTVSPSVFARWPFPLPNGRTASRVAHIRYELIVEPNKSTLKLFNDPADGSYLFSIGMIAVDNGKEYASYYTSANFRGETCDFEPEQVREMARCVAKFRDRANEKVKLGIPTPGYPIVVFENEIQRIIRNENSELVNDLVSIIENTVQDEPELHTQAIDQLEQQIGLGGMPRFISIGPSEQGHSVNVTGQLDGLTRGRPLATALLALGAGLLVARIAATFVRRLR